MHRATSFYKSLAQVRGNPPSLHCGEIHNGTARQIFRPPSSTDNYTAGFEHHATANGVLANDVTTPTFSGYIDDPPPGMMYGIFDGVAVSHLDMDLDDGSGDPPPYPGEPDPKVEAERESQYRRTCRWGNEAHH